MSGNYNNPDPNFDEEFGNSGGGLRKQLEEALAANKRLVERLDGADRAKTVTALLEGKHLSPEVSGLIPNDADPAEWIEKNAHFFAPAQQATSEGDGTPTELLDVQVAPMEDAAVQAERLARADMQNAQESGGPSAVVTNDALQKVEMATEEELLAMIKVAQGAAG